MKTLLFIFALISFSAFSQNADINLLRTINLERNQNLDPAFKFITHSDAPISVLTPSVILCVGLISKDSLTKQKAFEVGGSLFISTCFMTAMKYSFKRPRPFITYPDIQNVVPAGSPSFPSGHTSMAFSTATSLSLAYPKWYVIAPSFLWASSVGYSRMHLGVHYPSDVIVGAIIGAGSAWLSKFLTERVLIR